MPISDRAVVVRGYVEQSPTPPSGGVFNRGGIQISRSAVRRILQEEAVRPNRPWRCRMGNAPKHVRHPTEPNQVWHLDMTELRVLWMKVEVAAVLDGFTRKIVALKAFGRRPSTLDLVKLIDQAISDEGVRPRFVITDHGSQFRETFRAAIDDLGITHVRCSAGAWHLNAKEERVNGSPKAWARRAMLLPSIDAIRRRLAAYAEWHNRFRPQAAHGSFTPCEVEAAIHSNKPVRPEHHGETHPSIGVRRKSVRGHPRLTCTRVTVPQTRKRAA